jgi:hypothetical protein
VLLDIPYRSKSLNYSHFYCNYNSYHWHTDLRKNLQLVLADTKNSSPLLYEWDWSTVREVKQRYNLNLTVADQRINSIDINFTGDIVEQ